MPTDYARSFPTVDARSAMGVSNMKELTSNARIWRARLCAATFVALATVAVARGAEPQWVFNNGDAGARASVGQGKVESDFGLFRIQGTGSDTTLSVPMTEDQQFEALERPFFALRYNARTKSAYGGLFFTNDGKLKRLSDASFSQFPIIGDGTWREVIVDMREFSHHNWEGRITSFRLDPANPSDSDSSFGISRFGFFDAEDSARAFLNAANDKPNYDLSAEFSNEVGRCYLAKGLVSGEFDRADYLLAPEDWQIGALAGDREGYVVVCRREGSEQIVPLCDATSLGFMTYCSLGAGKYLVVDKSELFEKAKASGRPDSAAIKFSLARGFMKLVDAEKGFDPDANLDAATADRLTTVFNSLLALAPPQTDFNALLDRLAQIDSKPITRGETATLVMDSVRDALGTNTSSPYPSEYFTRDRLRIGAWGNFRVGDYDEEYMRAYADCGFDFLLNLAVPSAKVLKDADKFGVETYVNDGSYKNPATGAKEYCDHPSYTGCFIVDEPGSDDYDKLAAVCNPYEEATGKTAYINLLPMYANAAQLKYGAGAAAIEYYDSDPDLFRKYCAAFCEKFKTKYICTDIYPLNWVDGKKVTYDEYVESINIIASVAREYDREFWCYIQTFGWIPSKRTPTEDEFRWQCYSMLSFGCKCILCWTYAGYREGFPSLVDLTSHKTSAWYAARPVFWELRRLSDAYIQYRNLGAFTHNCSDATPYLKMSNEYDASEFVREIDCPDPLLVGCFAKKDASAKAFTLVNMTELEEARGTSVRMKLAGASATAWYRGAPQVVEPDADGWFVFHLASGEGVFVEIK